MKMVKSKRTIYLQLILSQICETRNRRKMIYIEELRNNVNVIIMIVLMAIYIEFYYELRHCSKVFHCINSVMISITL